jgi:DNA-binding transcriptional LysR family regulator
MALYDLNQILVFVNVVEQKGIRAAADRLGMAQSSVSRAITALEARLGTRLFERSTRAFRVTEEGQRYYEQCRAAVDVITQADELLRSRREELAGSLRVSAPAVLGKYLLSEVVSSFLVHHPRAQVLLDVTDRLVDMVPEGVDLAVRLGALPAKAQLVTRLLAQPAAGLYASASYLREHGVPGTPEDLRRHRTITLGTPDMAPVWRLRRGTENSVQALTPVLQTNDIPTLLNTTMNGCGICMAPHFVCRQERLPEALLQVLPEWENEPVDVRAVYPSHRSVTPLLRAFVDLLAERAPKALSVTQRNLGLQSGGPP